MTTNYSKNEVTSFIAIITKALDLEFSNICSNDTKEVYDIKIPCNLLITHTKLLNLREYLKKFNATTETYYSRLNYVENKNSNDIYNIGELTYSVGIFKDTNIINTTANQDLKIFTFTPNINSLLFNLVDILKELKIIPVVWKDPTIIKTIND